MSSLRLRMMIAVSLLAVVAVVAVALAARQRTRSEFSLSGTRENLDFVKPRRQFRPHRSIAGGPMLRTRCLARRRRC
jgi:hypothetical protein